MESRQNDAVAALGLNAVKLQTQQKPTFQPQ